jgi:hypothetical protein
LVAASLAATFSVIGCGSPTSPVTSGQAPSPAATANALAANSRADKVHVVAARSVDASGNPAGITQRFDASESQILVVVPSDGAPVGTEFEYTRYLDGKYLDSRSAKLTAPTRYFLFETKVVAGKQLVSGHWRYQIYMNRGYIGATEFVVA